MEALKTTLVLEEHLQQSTPPLKHFIQPVLKARFESSQLLWLLLRATSLRILATLVLRVPDVVCDELLNLLLLLARQLLLTDLVGTKHFHQARDILDEDVIASDHDLLVTVARARLGLTLRCRWRA